MADKAKKATGRDTWVKVSVGLFTHRKTLHLAEKWEKPPAECAGYCIRLWCWAIDYAPRDGELPRVYAIAKNAGWEGNVKQFVDDMVEAGFIDFDKHDGVHRIHNWIKHTEALHTSREKSAARQRVRREKVRNYRNGHYPEPNGHLSDGPYPSRVTTT